MKIVYFLLVLLVAAFASGCVDQKQSPDSVVTPAGENTAPAMDDDLDEFGIEDDLAEMDSLFNESSMDISFEVNGAFT